jgi:hypothetical protein
LSRSINFAQKVCFVQHRLQKNPGCARLTDYGGLHLAGIAIDQQALIDRSMRFKASSIKGLIDQPSID